MDGYFKIVVYGTHNDKMCAEILTGNTPNTPQLIRPIGQNQPIIWDILEKSPHHMSIVHVGRYINIYSAQKNEMLLKHSCNNKIFVGIKRIVFVCCRPFQKSKIKII